MATTAASAGKKDDGKAGGPSNSNKKSGAGKKQLVNPVLVTVGNPVLPHQTPVYAW